MANKYDKAVKAFDSLDLGDKIAAHKENAENLKKAIDEKKDQLKAQLISLGEAKDAVQ